MLNVLILRFVTDWWTMEELRLQHHRPDLRPRPDPSTPQPICLQAHPHRLPTLSIDRKVEN